MDSSFNVAQLAGNLFGFVLVIACCIWVFLDAKKLGMGNPGLWALGTFLCCLGVFPFYLFSRNKLQKEKERLRNI